MFGRAHLARGRGPDVGDRPATRADTDHLLRFAATHGGVEAYLEPATPVTTTTVVLVAASGEWTRRRVAGPDGARRVARRASVPLYDVALTGYPPRMRAWTAARRAAEREGPPGLRR